MNNSLTAIEEAIRDLRIEISGLEVQLNAKTMSLATLEGISQKMQNNETVVKDRTITKDVSLSSEQGALGLIDLNELDDSLSPKKRTLVDDVKDVVARFGAQEFNLGHVDGALRRQNIDVSGKSPKSRISVALVRLCRDDILVKTFTGVGNVPNRYRVRATMTEAEIAEAIAANPLPTETEDL